MPGNFQFVSHIDFCWTKKIHDCHVFPIYPTFKLIRKWKIFLADRLHGLDFWNSQNNCTFCNQFQFPRLVCGSVTRDPRLMFNKCFPIFLPNEFLLTFYFNFSLKWATLPSQSEADESHELWKWLDPDFSHYLNLVVNVKNRSSRENWIFVEAIFFLVAQI